MGRNVQFRNESGVPHIIPCKNGYFTSFNRVFNTVLKVKLKDFSDKTGILGQGYYVFPLFQENYFPQAVKNSSHRRTSFHKIFKNFSLSTPLFLHNSTERQGTGWNNDGFPLFHKFSRVVLWNKSEWIIPENPEKMEFSTFPRPLLLLLIIYL